MIQSIIHEFPIIPVSKKSLAFRKLAFGIGINDASYLTKIKISGKETRCPFYQRWRNMLLRCYCAKYQARQPTYKNCTVCPEWLTFSNFKAWMEKQDYKGKQLDKDILVTGNKVYSPEYCVFVTAQINKLLTDNKAFQGKFPTGVSLDKRCGKFIAGCNVDGKQKYLGHHQTELEAESAYLKFKSAHVLSVSEEQAEPLKSALIRISGEILNREYKKEVKL